MQNLRFHLKSKPKSLSFYIRNLTNIHPPLVRRGFRTLQRLDQEALECAPHRYTSVVSAK
jgi:hypothetical protein